MNLQKLKFHVSKNGFYQKILQYNLVLLSWWNLKSRICYWVSISQMSRIRIVSNSRIRKDVKFKLENSYNTALFLPRLRDRPAFREKVRIMCSQCSHMCFRTSVPKPQLHTHIIVKLLVPITLTVDKLDKQNILELKRVCFLLLVVC